MSAPFDTSARPKWPTEDVPSGVVEYKREPVRADGHLSSYLVATTDGLLLGYVYSTRSPWRTRSEWRAVGWTPRTADKTFGPFDARWHAMNFLLRIERGADIPGVIFERRFARGE